MAPGPCRHDDRPVIGVHGDHVRDRRRPKGTNYRPMSNPPSKLGYVAMGVSLGATAMNGLSNAVPPAYAR
jgi:hypothetical protein